MQELIRFSLWRRFNNRSTKIFNAIVFVVIACVMFSDKITQFVYPSFFSEKIVYVKELERDAIAYLNENAKDVYRFQESTKETRELVKEGSMVLEKQDDSYRLYTKYQAKDTLLASFSLYLNAYRKDKVMQNSENLETLLLYNQEIQVENKVLEKSEQLSDEKSNLIFVFVTGVYFMMLSFISTVASEVVNEKATKTLELILTSVSAKAHFFAKMCVGWLVIVLQGILSISYIVLWILIRNMYDQGNGFLQFVQKLGFVKSENLTFASLLKEMDFSYLFFEKLFVIVLFLLLGILFIQLIMVIVSSFVSSIEEAGNIQAPFYLVLLGLYYLTLAINTPQHLSDGIGKELSFVPFVNMLIMPCRILVCEVPLQEILSSLFISIGSIMVIVYKGIPIYERGVLDYSCKGFLAILKNMKSYKKSEGEKRFLKRG